MLEGFQEEERTDMSHRLGPQVGFLVAPAKGDKNNME